MKSGTYNVLKFVALVLLPAASTLYFALAGLWNLPHVQQVIGTISAVDAFLGTLLHISSRQYTQPTDGQLVIDKSDPAKDTYSINVNTPLDELGAKNIIHLSVSPAPTVSMRTTQP